MNWIRTLRRLLGRFWYDVFEDRDFLLGVEYLLSFYSKLTENKYLNWRNGMIAADPVVDQDDQPFIIYLDADIKREWFPWLKLWDSNTAYNLIHDISDDTRGWVTYSKESVQTPFYMVDHTVGYTKMLIEGLDYDAYRNRFLFYVNPATLGLPVVKMLDENGMPKMYYRLFGYQKKTVKVCDPVTGFESSWLNDCSAIAWDIHQNGVTYYNMKQLLGKVTGSVICEADGIVDAVWTEQGYNCLSVNGKVYISQHPANVALGATVNAGTVLFGSLEVYKGTDNPTDVQVPGVRVQTDAGELVALNQEDVDALDVRGMLVLPLDGPQDIVDRYSAICASNMMNSSCPSIQVPPKVNPYRFVTQVLRRGRSVIVRLTANGLDRLAAAINCIRKSCCASGMVNIYVSAETDPGTVETSVFSADAGMMAVAVTETLTIKAACAEAEVIL